MIASERQLRRIRYALFESILKQEIGWFDCRNAHFQADRNYSKNPKCERITIKPSNNRAIIK